MTFIFRSLLFSIPDLEFNLSETESQGIAPHFFLTSVSFLGDFIAKWTLKPPGFGRESSMGLLKDSHL